MALQPVQAAAIRRGLIVATAATATFGAHALAGGARPGAVTLGVVLALVSLGVLTTSSPSRPWRRLGALRIGLAVSLVQVALHLGMTNAPWAFGLSVHQHSTGGLVGGVAAHLAAGVLLTLAALFGERLLDRLVRATRRLVRHLMPRRPAGGARHLPVGLRAAVAPLAPAAPPSSRGPPQLTV